MGNRKIFLYQSNREQAENVGTSLAKIQPEMKTKEARTCKQVNENPKIKKPKKNKRKSDKKEKLDNRNNKPIEVSKTKIQ